MCNISFSDYKWLTKLLQLSPRKKVRLLLFCRHNSKLFFERITTRHKVDITRILKTILLLCTCAQGFIRPSFSSYSSLRWMDTECIFTSFIFFSGGKFRLLQVLPYSDFSIKLTIALGEKVLFTNLIHRRGYSNKG